MNPLTFQLNRLFEQLSQQQPAIDSTAAVLAQAAVSEGTIFIAAFGEMKAVTAAALLSEEPLMAAAEWSPSSIVMSTDRVWILATNKEGDELAGRLSDAGIPFALVSSQSDESELADAFLPLDSVVLQDDGDPVWVPRAMAALYIYYAVKLSIDKLLAE
ncbi:hypothetical protein QOZ98_001123 [Planomicrobium stackebrandtii]|uniref:DUF2529 domain-containing protein n=1 Tax=Planomicrobium stackebrandtii TaxID=253160 RepID=A0ABU0GSG4_9BACL|nr:DUF2529 family protein [Planomicrobium stackebrandtii]MDQ0428297.1 hypothetical protein [Planomicrobium stackebrandtii]